MNRLDFTLSLIDNLTRPLRQARASIQGFANTSTQAFGQIGIGAAGLVGAGMAIKGALEPAMQMYDAIQEASGRGVNDGALKQITRQALQFSMTYGTVADDYVRSSADIRNAVSGLTESDLPKITRVANTVAKALGATSAETAEFMGQMFGNFRAEADALGNVQFAEQLAGKMAYMRKEFGAGMADIKDLVEGARGAGSNYGVSLNEQLAVMGELRKTLGSEASGSYESFLTGATEGAKKLGLSFTDTNGRLLSMPAMMEKIQGKYGASIAGNLKAQAELDEAFGDSAAVIKQLYGNVGTLQRHITELGGNDGMKRTTEMAEKMTKPWDRLMAVWRAIRVAIGLTLLPVLYPLIDTLANGGQKFAKWMELFPNIARVIGYVTLAVLAMGAAGAVASILMGLHMFVMQGLAGLLAPVARLLGLNRLAMLAGNVAARIFTSGLRALRAGLLAASIAARVGGASFLLMAWPVALVAAAIGALVAAVVIFWRPIKAFISGFIDGFSLAADSLGPFSGIFQAIGGAVSVVWQAVKTLFGWFGSLLAPVQYTTGELEGATNAGRVFGQVVSAAIGFLLLPIELAINSLRTLFDIIGIIRDGWLDVIAVFDLASPVESFKKMGAVIGNVFTNLWAAIKSAFTDTYNSIITRLNKIPGVSIDLLTTEAATPAVNSLPQGSAAAAGTAAAGLLAPVPSVPVSSLTAPAASVPPVMMPQAASPVAAVPVATPQRQETLKPQALTGGQLKGVGRNGVAGDVNNNQKVYNDNSRSMGNVTVNVSNGMTPDQLREWQELQA